MAVRFHRLQSELPVLHARRIRAIGSCCWRPRRRWLVVKRLKSKEENKIKSKTNERKKKHRGNAAAGY